jgi:hypothetical protein
MFSASRLASFKIDAASFFAFLIRLETLLFSKNFAIPNHPPIPTIAASIINVISIFCFCFRYKKSLH